jgi:hypothetical protein
MTPLSHCFYQTVRKETKNNKMEQLETNMYCSRRHGDLTLAPTTLLAEKLESQPLHQFQLLPHFSSPSKSSALSSSSELEFSLPERLDLGISERGIVGRQVTVFARGQAGEVIPMGNGIVGYD